MGPAHTYSSDSVGHQVAPEHVQPVPSGPIRGHRSPEHAPWAPGHTSSSRSPDGALSGRLHQGDTRRFSETEQRKPLGRGRPRTSDRDSRVRRPGKSSYEDHGDESTHTDGRRASLTAPKAALRTVVNPVKKVTPPHCIYPCSQGARYPTPLLGASARPPLS